MLRYSDPKELCKKLEHRRLNHKILVFVIIYLLKINICNSLFTYLLKYKYLFIYLFTQKLFNWSNNK